jgi:hypothetical protein
MNSISSGWWVAAAIAGLTLGGCGTLRPPLALTPIGISRVSVNEMPADVKRFRHGGAALRVDFYSNPELLSETVSHIMDSVRFCDSSDELPGMGSPYFGDIAIRRDVPREKARAAWANGHQAATRPVYSTYVYIALPEIPAASGTPYRPAFDLTKQPRALCVSLSLRDGYEIARTTNTMAFSAEQVRAALQSAR